MKDGNVKNGKIIYASNAMKNVLETAERVAKAGREKPGDMDVMLYGETGTGKELVANYIHEHSGRHGKIVTVNCAAIQDNLLESDLFGHEKGSFTGSNAKRIGKLQEADGGTLFLDEIYDIPMVAQEMLLRPLDGYSFQRVGSNENIEPEFKLVVATNKDLKEAVKNDRIRNDFYHRLPDFTITIPPLRERKEDIIVLIEYFLEELNRRNGYKEIPRESMEALLAYEWPGNVRELKKKIGGAYLMADDGVLRFDSLENPEARNVKAEYHRLEETEMSAINEALHENYYNQRRAAESLGISYSALRRRIAKYGISIK